MVGALLGRVAVVAAVLFCTPALAQQSAGAGDGTPAATAPPYGLPISLKQARKVISAGEAEARRWHVNPTFAICDSGGNLVLFEKMDNADYGDSDIVIAMAKSAAAFRRSTKEFAIAVARNPAEAFLSGIVPFEGGWPLVIDGKIVGAIGITGTRGVRTSDGRPTGEIIAEAALAAAK